MTLYASWITKNKYFMLLDNGIFNDDGESQPFSTKGIKQIQRYRYTIGDVRYSTFFLGSSGDLKNIRDFNNIFKQHCKKISIRSDQSLRDFIQDILDKYGSNDGDNLNSILSCSEGIFEITGSVVYPVLKPFHAVGSVAKFAKGYLSAKLPENESEVKDFFEACQSQVFLGNSYELKVGVLP